MVQKAGGLVGGNLCRRPPWGGTRVLVHMPGLGGGCPSCTVTCWAQGRVAMSQETQKASIVGVLALRTLGCPESGLLSREGQRSQLCSKCGLRTRLGTSRVGHGCGGSSEVLCVAVEVNAGLLLPTCSGCHMARTPMGVASPCCWSSPGSSPGCTPTSALTPRK